MCSLLFSLDTGYANQYKGGTINLIIFSILDSGGDLS